jgi:hypothetical protein
MTSKNKEGRKAKFALEEEWLEVRLDTFGFLGLQAEVGADLKGNNILFKILRYCRPL